MHVEHRVIIVVMLLLRQRITFFRSIPTLYFVIGGPLFTTTSTGSFVSVDTFFGDTNCGNTNTFSLNCAMVAIGVVAAATVACPLALILLVRTLLEAP